jgi:hypothetical protein
MSKYTKKRAVIVLLVYLCIIAVCIAVAYIPTLSHLEMIFKILPQTILYLFFGFAITYTQSHYNNKEASNGAKYVSITNPFLKRILIPKERTKDTDGYIKVENRSKITISSLLLYLIGIIIVINIFVMMLIPQVQTEEIRVLIGGRLSHGDVVINTINSIVVYFSSLAFMILPLLVFFARRIYFGARAKNKTNSNLSN